MPHRARNTGFANANLGKHSLAIDAVKEIGLDAEELMHLALKAMRQDRDDDAILFLKHAILQAPNEGRLHYLLGALYAELGMMQRAIATMTCAVELDPDLATANFQLGLLHASVGDAGAAREAWKPLDEFGEDEPLRIFKRGMEYLLVEDYAKCIAELKRGIERNEMLESLNVDMQRVIEQAEGALSGQSGKSGGSGSRNTGAVLLAAAKLPAKDTEHVLLAAYRRQDDKAN
jgi:tetratricopeptide (TPR) repeat protein